MKKRWLTYHLNSLLLALAFAITPAHAEFLDIATQPLQTSGNTVVLPNIMFVLDDSGSMSWDFTPDWVQRTDDNPAEFKSPTPDLQFLRNPAYNLQYYNPEVLYTPPVTHTGSSMGNQTSFTQVENDVNAYGVTVNNTTNITSGNTASYYAYVSGEYCTNANLTSCVASNEATATNKFPAPIRWCNSNAAATATTLTGTQACQGIRNNLANSAGNRFVALRQPIATYRLTVNISRSTTVSSVKINNIELLSSDNINASSSNTLASAIVSSMNQCTSVTATTICQLRPYESVTRSGNVITIKTLAGAPLNPAAPIQVTMNGVGATYTGTFVSSQVPGSLTFVKIQSGITYTAPGKTARSPDRTDCASTVACTYTEEMTNFANWWTYYRTRIQSMRTAASLAFKSIDYRYKVGFVSINYDQNSDTKKKLYLPLKPFNTAQKKDWYEKLYAATPSGGTPLRYALNNVGKMYAGKNQFASDDPLEYACQKNYTLLTTDGYWTDPTNAPPNSIANSPVGDVDGNAPTPMRDVLKASNTLADIAKYYYDTDIRSATFSNCTNGNVNVCGTEEDFPKQNMITLTLGLGIDGTLAFTDDYKNQTVGDFADLKNPSNPKAWPDPTTFTTINTWFGQQRIDNSDGRKIDDLWHAAVNAGGTYYSAKNPKLLRESLIQGLSEIKSINGAGSAAAASSLAPVAGDNYQYVASYETVKWIGNLEARQVDTKTMRTTETATWCVESIGATGCPTGASSETLTINNTQSLYCKTTSSNQDACDALGGNLGGVLGLNGQESTCYVDIGKSCDGRLKNQLGSRNIYFNNANTRAEFKPDSITASIRTILDAGYLALSQFTGLPASDSRMTDTAKSNKLVDYLVGNKTYEDRASNATAQNRLFRERQATLGDITESRPVYYKEPFLNYTDAGFSNFKANNMSRQAVVYVGANDGMLHAFNADTGNELWAFIPTPVIKNLAALADKEYGTVFHKNFVNGSPLITEICASACNTSNAVWKTILVSGLNGGGRGYFALDVTTPTDPKILWEFFAENTSDKRNIGLSYGNPVVTKLSNGKWVVLLTSGYNNGNNSADKNSAGTYIANNPQGDGKGYLYMLNANTGALEGSMTTNEGDGSNPSGLAKINAYSKTGFKSAAADYVYGGDLNGNVWRFEINNNKVVKVASLKDGSGNAQKITTIPEFATISGKRVVYIGTGKFLENGDLLNTPSNSVYGFKDDNLTQPFNLGSLVTQTLSTSGDQRTASNTKVDFSTKAGWRTNLPVGERVNVSPTLINGALLMPSLTPNSASCEGAGYGWFNYFDYKTGGALPNSSGIVSEKLSSPSVGFNITYKPDGSVVVSNTSSTDPTPSILENSNLANSIGGGKGINERVFNNDAGKAQKQGYGTKHSWRELFLE